jgi:sn-glycerol 3-phosphate transport system permease protein
MIENRRGLSLVAHTILLLGVVVVCLPIYIAFVASTHTVQELLHAPIPILPGHAFVKNYSSVLFHGLNSTLGQPIYKMMWNSFVMALLIAFGKIAVSIISAFALVYCQFPWKRTCFWVIFLTLMLPVEVRIVPTFQVVAQLDMLNSFAGLTFPLLASATATFLFRQFFLTIGPELVEAARLDGAGPIRFFWDIVLPLSRTNIAALFIIMFIYGWNQYLWPLVVTTRGDMNTIVMGIQKLSSVADQIPQWNDIMAIAILAMLPPVVVVIMMQKLFVKGLLDVEK